MTRRTHAGQVISVSGAAWAGEHPGISGQAVGLAWEGWRTEPRGPGGKWIHGLGKPASASVLSKENVTSTLIQAFRDTDDSDVQDALTGAARSWDAGDHAEAIRYLRAASTIADQRGRTASATHYRSLAAAIEARDVTPGTPEGTGPLTPQVRHLASLLPEVDKAIAAGHFTEAEQGTQGVVRFVTLPSGEQVLDKRIADPVDMDREELSSYVAKAIGAPTPAIYRAAPDRELEEVVQGKTAARYFSDIMDKAYKKSEAEGHSAMENIAAEEEAEDEARNRVFDSPGAKAIAKLDYLIANEDRNESNWMITPDGKPVAIDHGVAGMDGYPSDSPFVMSSMPELQKAGSLGSGTPENAALGRKLADQLYPLQAQFARTGHQDWFDDMMATPVAQLINPDDTRLAYYQIMKHWQDDLGGPEPWMARPRGA